MRPYLVTFWPGVFVGPGAPLFNLYAQPHTSVPVVATDELDAVHAARQFTYIPQGALIIVNLVVPA